MSILLRNLIIFKIFIFVQKLIHQWWWPKVQTGSETRESPATAYSTEEPRWKATDCGRREKLASILVAAGTQRRELLLLHRWWKEWLSAASQAHLDLLVLLTRPANCQTTKSEEAIRTNLMGSKKCQSIRKCWLILFSVTICICYQGIKVLRKTGQIGKVLDNINKVIK